MRDEKLEFAGQVIELIILGKISTDTFELFMNDIGYEFPVLTEDITESYLKILYHHINEIAE